ncbi:MAG: hypothetical protein QXN05_01070 [Acidilobaceae archaeon]
MGVEDLIAAANLLKGVIPKAEVDLGFYFALTGLLILAGLFIIGTGFFLYRIVYVITHKEVAFFLKFVFIIGVSLVILSLLLP